MSNYRIGAFEALAWAWHMLRGYRDRPRGVDEARRLIQEVLSSMGQGADIDFGEKIRGQNPPDAHGLLHQPPAQVAP